MTIDIVALGLGLIFGYLGWRSGATAQCLRLLAAIVAFFAAAPVARIARGTLFPSTNLSGPVLEGLLLVVAGVVVYLVLAVAAWLFVRAIWAASDSLTVVDRVGGMALGLLKAAVLVYFLVSTVAVMRGPLEEVDENDVLHVRDSRVLRTVESYNVLILWRFGDLQRLHSAIKVDRAARTGPAEAAKLVRRKGRASDFLRSDKMKTLRDQTHLVEAALEDEYYYTLANPKVREFLNDDRFVARLRLVNWSELLEKLRARVPSSAEVGWGVSPHAASFARTVRLRLQWWSPRASRSEKRRSARVRLSPAG